MSTFFVRILLLTALFSNFIYAQNTTLRYNLKVGDSVKIFQKANQEIVQELDGTKHELKNALETDYTLIVLQATDSLYTMQLTFNRFKLLSTSNLSGEVVNIDTNSDTPSDNIQETLFADMIGAALKMEMYRTGKIKAVSGTEKMIANMVNKAGIQDEFTKQIMVETMKKEFGNKSLASSFEQITYIYPNKKVTVGDTWTNKHKGKLNTVNTWKLEAADEKSMTLSGKSDVKMFSSEQNLTMALNGTQETNIVAGKPSGFAKQMTVNLTAEGVSTMEQMNDTKIPTSLTSTTTYKTHIYVQ